MDEQIKYGPRVHPGIFWSLVALFLAVTTLALVLTVPTMVALATPGKPATAPGQTEKVGSVSVYDLSAKRTKLSAKTEAKPIASTDTYQDKYGALTDGAVTNVREGATLTWRAEQTCASGASSRFEVVVTHQPLSEADANAAPERRVFSNLTDQKLYVTNVQNGLTYDFTVAGRCANAAGDTYGEVARTSFTQTLPQPAGVIVKKHAGADRYSLLQGRVSSSPAVDYEVQYRQNGNDWTPFKTVDAGEMWTGGPAGFYGTTATEFRVRAYTSDDSVRSDWSGSSTLRYGTGGSSGYGYRTYGYGYGR